MTEILIIDFGSQYTQLIFHTFMYRLSANVRLIDVVAFNKLNLTKDCPQLKAIVLSGSPRSVNMESVDIKVKPLAKHYYVLGICYGAQLIAKEYGCKLASTAGQYGEAVISVTQEDDLFSNIPPRFKTWMSHGDHLVRVSKHVQVLAYAANNMPAAWKVQKRIYGTQFHPEVNNTEYGQDILRNFMNIAGVVPKRDKGSLVHQIMKQIKNQVGQNKVLLALSGGVDSTTLAYMLHRSIGSQMRAVIIDNGLMRSNEISEIVEQFRSEPIEQSIVVAHAEDMFISRLAGVTDPEFKRQIIGKTFIDVIISEGRKLEAQGFKATFLAQGTIYPDVIESGAVPGSSVIKSHHNVGGLPKDIPFKLIEPFRYLFKDDVRLIANYLNIPIAMYTRKPFPGPGLAIRIIGAITEERLKIAREADLLLRSELARLEQNKRIWQTAAILLPIKTVGVKGDNRSYEHVIALRMVDSVNGMTAQSSLVPIDTLHYIARQITDHVKGVNRVVYDLSSKPPATIEWE